MASTTEKRESSFYRPLDIMLNKILAMQESRWTLPPCRRSSRRPTLRNSITVRTRPATSARTKRASPTSTNAASCGKLISEWSPFYACYIYSHFSIGVFNWRFWWSDLRSWRRVPRVNISNAVLFGLESDLNLTGDQYNNALVILYVLLHVHSYWNRVADLP